MTCAVKNKYIGACGKGKKFCVTAKECLVILIFLHELWLIHTEQNRGRHQDSDGDQANGKQCFPVRPLSLS